MQASKTTQFKAACETLWNEQVRTDLIFSRRLLYCKACVCFFYGSNETNTHPQCMTTTSQQLCQDNNINSEDTLAEVLWKEASGLSWLFGETPLPRYSTVHLEPAQPVQPASQPRPRSPAKKNDQFQWHCRRIKALEADVAKLQASLAKSQQENQRLQQDADRWMELFLAEQVFKAEIKAQAEPHLRSLLLLLQSPSAQQLGPPNQPK